jgi:dCTP diphosphatase
MTSLRQLIEKIIQFRNRRDWKQFHTPKDMAISLMLEAGEVAEHFQWKNRKEMDEYIRTNKEDIGEELADVLWWVLLMCHDLNIDILDAFEKKQKKNEMRYPVEKSKGKHTKWTHL